MQVSIPARAPMIVGPDPARAPTHGATDAPTRLDMPKVAINSANADPLQPTVRKVSKYRMVIAAPFARNHTWVETANGLRVR